MRLFLLSLLLVLSFNSKATLISLESDHTQYQVGDTVQLNLLVSNLTGTLGGFFSALSYATEGFNLLNWQFGNGFDDGLGSLQLADHDALAGLLALDDYADLAADENLLSSLQGQGFLLASVEFQALQSGSFLFNLNPDWTGILSFDNQFIPTELRTLTVEVMSDARPVPAPATLLLFAIGLIALRARSN